jgi:niacin transporter
MNNFTENAIAVKPLTLELKGIRPYLFTSLFIAIAVGLPSAAHFAGAPVRYLLPMHWTIILAGLIYGKKGGALCGFLAPSVSFLISGMPFPPMILPMTIELAAYGFITGLLRENFKLNSFASIAISLIAGRILFLITVLFMGSFTGLFLEYAKAAMLPGVFAGLAQIVILPFIAKLWIKKENGV